MSSEILRDMNGHTPPNDEMDVRGTLLEHDQDIQEGQLDHSHSSSSPKPSALASALVATPAVPVINVHSIYRNDPVQHAALLEKLTWRLLPFLLILYLFSYLDRSNLSNVHKAMVADIDLSEQQYGSAVSVFFIPYVLLEVPSNMILERVDARRWLARIICSWGAISTLMLAIQGYGGLVVARLLLGIAEAGFFPGIIFYLTLWFTPAERAQRLAWIFVAVPLAGITGGLLAYPILNYLHGVGGMAGWRWVFLLEGTPTVFLGVATWMYLPANPMEASWLSMEERVFLTARMKGVSAHGGESHDDDHGESSSNHVHARALDEDRLRDESSRSNSADMTETTPAFAEYDGRSIANNNDNEESRLDVNSSAVGSTDETSSSSGLQTYPGGLFTPATWRARLEVMYAESKAECEKLYRTTFSNRIIYLCIVTNFLILMPVQAITFYLPSIVAEIGVGPLIGNLISAIPYSFAAISMFAVSIYSDRTGQRAKPIIWCNILGFVSLALTAATMSVDSTSPALIFWQLFFLSFTAAGVWSCKPALMALFTTNLIGNIAVAIAAVTTVGNISGIVAPLVMSALRESSGNYASGCLFLMACLVVASWTVAALNREIMKVQALKNERAAAATVEMQERGGNTTATARNDYSSTNDAALVAAMSPPPYAEEVDSEAPFSPVAAAVEASPMIVDVVEVPTEPPRSNRSKLK